MQREAGRYWDRRARENALYFVDNGLDYGRPDSTAFWQRGEEAVDRILGAVDVRVRATDRIVDIGCGVGRLTRVLADRAREVVAVDVSREMLARARELNAGLSNVEWTQGDGLSLAPIEDASVDGCFSHVVFQHIPDPEVTLNYVREMGRVLRQGAWAVFVVSTDPEVHRRRPTIPMRMRSLVGLGPRGGDHPAWLGSAVEEAPLRAAVADGRCSIRHLLHPGSQFTIVHMVRD